RSETARRARSTTRTTTSSRTRERSHPRIHVAEPLALRRPRRRGVEALAWDLDPLRAVPACEGSLPPSGDRLLVPAPRTRLEDDLREASAVCVLHRIVADGVRHHAVRAREVGHVP